MKKTFFFLCLICGIVLSACQQDCIKCNGAKVCEDDYGNSSTGVSWQDYKEQKIQSGECTEQ